MVDVPESALLYPLEWHFPWPPRSAPPAGVVLREIGPA